MLGMLADGGPGQRRRACVLPAATRQRLGMLRGCGRGRGGERPGDVRCRVARLLARRHHRLAGRRVLRWPGGMVSGCRVVPWWGRMQARMGLLAGQHRGAGQCGWHGRLGRGPRLAYRACLGRLCWRQAWLDGDVARARRAALSRAMLAHRTCGGAIPGCGPGGEVRL